MSKQVGKAGSGSTGDSNKSRTSGEAFFHFLKSIGYQHNAKHDRPEHFEYLFRDEKSANLVKAIMKIGKRDFVLATDEVERYETLKIDGLALFGTDLERAVDTRHAYEIQISESTQESAVKLQKLTALIELRKSEIRNIRNKRFVMSAMAEERLRTIDDLQRIAARMQIDSQEFDIAIEVARKRLNDKQQKLRQVKANVIAKGNEQQRQSSLANSECWKSIVLREDRLMKVVGPLIREHVSGLIVQAEGYNNEGQQGDAGIRKIIADHANNLERLKHCMIYERTRSSKLKIKLAGEESEDTSLEKLKQWHEQYMKIVRCTEDRKLMEKFRFQIDDETRSLEEVFESEYSPLVEKIREGSLNHMNNQINTLTESKSRAQNTLQNFFVKVYGILEPQKVRLDVLRSLLKAEINFYLNLEEMLFYYSHRSEILKMESEIRAGSFNSNWLTPDGQALNETLWQMEISPTVFKSTSQTLDSLMNIYRSLIQSRWDYFNRHDVQEDQYLTSVSNKHRQLVQLLEGLNLHNATTRCEELRHVEMLENAHSETLQTLTSMKENHKNIVEEHIREKGALLKEMEDTFSKQ